MSRPPGASSTSDVVGVDGGDGGRHAQFDVMGFVEVSRVDGGTVEVGLAAQVVLGQRRSLVGADRFVADQNNPAVEAFAAQGLGGLGSGQAGADDHEGVCGRHRMKRYPTGPGRQAGRDRAGDVSSVFNTAPRRTT